MCSICTTAAVSSDLVSSIACAPRRAGGYSAGAITALHYAYVNTDEEVLEMGGPELLDYVKKHGGLNGDSGNPGYPSKIKGVINISGSLYRAKFIAPGDPVLFSVHGTADDIVPFVSGATGDTDIITEGSALIHVRAGQVGIINQLVKIEDDDHLAFFGCANCMQKLRQFVCLNLK